MCKRRSRVMDMNHAVYYRGERIGVELHRARGFTEAQLNRYLDILKDVIVIINSVEFKIAVTSRRDLVSTNNMTAVEVYDFFMSGKDAYQDEADGDIDVDVTLYFTRRRTVGMTYTGSMRYYFNRKYWHDKPTVGGNMIHESVHNMGFFDDGPLSVPYFYGDTVTRMLRDMERGRTFTPVSDDMLSRSEKPLLDSDKPPKEF